MNRYQQKNLKKICFGYFGVDFYVFFIYVK